MRAQVWISTTIILDPDIDFSYLRKKINAFIPGIFFGVELRLNRHFLSLLIDSIPVFKVPFFQASILT